MQNQNLGWDFQVPPDHRMVEQNLSSAIDNCAIFQACMWDIIEHMNKNESRASRGHPTKPIKH